MPLDPNWMRWLAQGPVTGADLPPDQNNLVPFGGTLPPDMSMAMMTPPDAVGAPPTTGGFGGSNALGLAAILGGLGLGLARPRIAPQALNNFQAANMMEWRNDQKEFARQRLALAQQERDIQLANLAEMQGGGGQPATQQFTAPPPAAPPSTPEVSAVPHFNLAPGGPGGVTQFTPESRMAAQPDQPFFSGAPAPIQGNVSNSLSAFNRTQTRSTTRGTEKEQATTAAINDLTSAWIENPDQAQRDPRRLLKEVMQRYPMADSKEIRQNLSNTLFETYHTAVLTDQPGLDPKSAYRQAYSAAAKDLGPGMFTPTDQMRTLATGVASEGEHRGLAIGADDTRRLGQLNVYEGNQRAAVRGAENTADIYTKGMSPTDAQKYAIPPRAGTTQAQMFGQRPMSVKEETGITVQERERSQTQTAVETVAPAVSGIVKKAEDIRKSFEGLGLQGAFQKGKNWFDVMQAQITGFPATEMGKLVQSYDTLVENNGPLMARVVQAQRGNLTEMERKIGERGFPSTFRELYNNPVAGNDRLAVLSDVLGLELRDPTFSLGRLDVPASEFEKSIMAVRQQRIATRPELYSNPPMLGAPSMAPMSTPAAPPSLSNAPMTPEDQAVIDQINKELQLNTKPRKK